MRRAVAPDAAQLRIVASPCGPDMDMAADRAEEHVVPRDLVGDARRVVVARQAHCLGEAARADQPIH
jgi:hypothetical protein